MYEKTNPSKMARLEMADHDPESSRRAGPQFDVRYGPQLRLIYFDLIWFELYVVEWVVSSPWPLRATWAYLGVLGGLGGRVELLIISVSTFAPVDLKRVHFVGPITIKLGFVAVRLRSVATHLPTLVQGIQQKSPKSPWATRESACRRPSPKMLNKTNMIW